MTCFISDFVLNLPVSFVLNAAISAGIQKLEEELGASIENEDASSMGTLSEKHALEHESQPSDDQLVVGQQATEQNTEETSSQVDVSVTCKTMSEIRTSYNQSENRTARILDITSAKTERVEINEGYLEPQDTTAEKTEDFKTQDTDNSSLRDASSVQKSKDIDRTVDTDEISRTIDTSDVIRSVEKSDVSRTFDPVDTRGTVDTTDVISRSVDTSDTSGTVDLSDVIRSVGTGDTSGTVNTSELNLTVDTSDASRTVDTSDASRTVDPIDVTRSLDSSVDKSGTVGTSDIHATETE